MRARIDGNGRLAIPAAIRKALGINPGDEVVLRIENDELHVSTVEQALKRAQHLVRRHIPEGQSLSDELIRDRCRETERE
jgi:AbrB family looped-hinge helix DNA binding protein